ncbi:hypothetical protein [Vibrio sp. 99-70-13A1]|uniref:hypothetical protein n=1 Tax=Vibrio sp. 99-70-13A1 TaxID=2607601 RepID=UPI00149333BD|nr:hypothetical protein [Vibrio sp. 99-70-13A1]NOH97923.1 hypothetical protein [Vibrio sp. 99-70-13A1]
MNIFSKLLLATLALTSTVGCTSTRYASNLMVASPIKSINLAPTINTLTNVTKALTPVILTLAQPVVISPKIVLSN